MARKLIASARAKREKKRIRESKVIPVRELPETTKQHMIEGLLRIGWNRIGRQHTERNQHWSFADDNWDTDESGGKTSG